MTPYERADESAYNFGARHLRTYMPGRCYSQVDKAIYEGITLLSTRIRCVIQEGLL